MTSPRATDTPSSAGVLVRLAGALLPLLGGAVLHPWRTYLSDRPRIDTDDARTLSIDAFSRPGNSHQWCR
jgi:hypothetical protein